jgi:hypothetical protein
MSTSRQRPPATRHGRQTQKARQTRAKQNARSRVLHGSGQRPVRKLPIPLRVALILVWPVLIIQILNVIFFLSPYGWFSLGLLLVYFVAGLIGGNLWFADRPRLVHNAKPRTVQEGAACGITIGIISFLIMLVIFLLVGAVTYTVGWLFGGVSVIFCAPSDIIVSLVLGAFGGWVSEKTH